MVAAKYEFPKVNGDIDYAEEGNAFLQALKNTCDMSMQSTTTIDVMTEEVTAFKIVDLFTDSTGDNNTVDTGTTTATYNTTYDIYHCPLSISTVVGEPGMETVVDWVYTETDTSGTYSGTQTAAWASEGTNSYLFTVNGGSTAGDKNRIGRTVNFDNIDFISFDYNITEPGTSTAFQTAVAYIDAVNIFSVSLSSTGTGTQVYNCQAITGNKTLYFGINHADGGGTINNQKFYVDNIKTYTTTAFVQSAATTISGTYTSAFVRPRYLYANPTGTSVTHQISLDGGSNYSTATSDGNIIDLTGLSGTSLICKTSLNADSNHYHTPAIKGWCVLLW